MNYMLLNYYTDPNEKVRIAMITQVVAFSSILVYITLIPFDVYATVNHYKTIIFDIKVYDLYFCK